jgi:hypothetical protein
LTRSNHNAKEPREIIRVRRYKHHYMAASIHAEPVEGESLMEMIKEDLIAERIAIKSGMRAKPTSRTSPRRTYPKAAQRSPARRDVKRGCS